MKKLFACLLLFFVIFIFSSSHSFAKIGVGINTGEIRIKEPLKAGMIHRLPSITIINTGDEPGDYITNVAYQQEYTEIQPNKNWFIFSPSEFYLQPKEGKAIEVKLNLPLNVKPGNYFCYLEGRPGSSIQQKKGTVLGVAAGAKLYFTVVEANIFYALYFKISSLYNIYLPWSQYLLVALAIIIIILFFKKFFNIQINVKKSNKKYPLDDDSL